MADPQRPSQSSKWIGQVGCLYGLMVDGPVLDRGEIARATGFNVQRVTPALERLAAQGAVREGTPDELGWQRPEGRSGASPQTAYCLPNDWGYAIGVAAGHHGVGTGLIDARGQFSEHGSGLEECLIGQPLEINARYWTTIEVIAAQITACVTQRTEQLRATGQSRDLLRPEAITVAFPGQISAVRDPDLNQRRIVTVLGSFRDKPVAEDLRQQLAHHEQELGFDPRHIPIALENDADCLAMGELYWGEGVGRQSLLVIKVSAGVGAGLVIDGAIHYGTLATAGEVGHDPVHETELDALNAERPKNLSMLDPANDVFRCSCSPEQSGHLEAFASASAVACRVLNKPRHEISARRWATALGKIIEAATRNRHSAQGRAVYDAGVMIGRLINTLATAVGPEKVLVCGALAEAELLLAAIQDQVETVQAPLTHAPRDVVFGTRGDAARWIAVRGAARLALERGVWGPARTVAHYEWPGFSVAEALVYESQLNVNAR